MIPAKNALHSSRIGVATTLAAEGEVLQRMIHRYGRWKYSKSSKAHTRKNPEDAAIYLVHYQIRAKQSRRSQARVPYGANHRSIYPTSGLGYVDGC